MADATDAALAGMRAAAMRAALAKIQADMSLEATLERAYEGKLPVRDLVPSPLDTAEWKKWLDRNSQGRNPFQRAVDRLLSPITTAEVQWSGDKNWSKAEREAAKARIQELVEIVPDLARDLALKGKAGAMPWRDADSQEVEVALLSGYLHPIWSPFNALKLERLLVFVPGDDGAGGVEWTVWEFTRGEVTIREGVRDPVQFATQGEAKPYPLEDGLGEEFPAVFATLLRGADRAPAGFGANGLSAYRKYLRSLIQENASSEQVGMPQRVVYGRVLNGEEALTRWNPYSALHLDADGKVEYPFPEHLEQLRDGTDRAARDVAESLHAPEVTNGAGESGDARLTSLEELVQAASTIANRVAQILTRVWALLAAMGEVREGLEFSLQPEFSGLLTERQNAIVGMFKEQLISRFEALTRLQEVGVNVSQEELDAARLERDERKLQPVVVGDLNGGAAPAAAGGGNGGQPGDPAAPQGG